MGGVDRQTCGGRGGGRDGELKGGQEDQML